MSIEKGIYTHLTGNPGVSALIGDALYPLAAPENTKLPYIVYQRISGARVRSLAGPSGLARPRFQFDIYADSYDRVKQIADAFREAMDGYSGLMGDVEVAACSMAGERDKYQQRSGVYGVTMDFMITHME